MPTLVLTPRQTDDAQALWRAAGRLGWRVERLTSWRVPDDLRGVPEPVLYLEALIGPTLAGQFGLRLLEPPDDWLSTLPEEYRRRAAHLTTFAEARRLTEPAFVKPPNSKSFPARVYTGAELPDGYADDAPVLVQEVVRWEWEFRCFVLNRHLRTLSVYLRDGELQRTNDFTATDDELAEATAFVNRVLADERVNFPRACVLDEGVIAGRGWAAVELNAAWGSGLYGCDPAEVLEVLRHAGEPVAR